MCFSATASFTAAAVLIPLGMYCIKDTISWDKTYIPFACYPLFFGIQQMIEGLIWQAKDNGLNAEITIYGFFFFSHLFWLFWVPFSVWIIERNQQKKQMMFYSIFAGLIFGLSMYIPLYTNDNWFSIAITNHSISYKVILIYDRIMPRQIVQFIYTLIVVLPLLFTSVKIIKRFGLMILMSIFLASYYFEYAFVSVWCYFSAILSSYLYFVLYQAKKIALNEIYPKVS